MKKVSDTSQTRSITLTVLIGSYIVVMLAGLCMAVAGITAPINLSLNEKGFKLSTTNTGLALVVCGGFLAGFVALRVPKGVRVFSPGNKPPKIEEFARKAGLPLFALGLLALALIFLLPAR
jgi:hypothetical protein